MSSTRERHRRRDDRVDDGKRKHSKGSRSRSRKEGRRRRRGEGAAPASSAPPQEWLGPRETRGPPPAEWRGPPGYGGMPPGAYPPPRAPLEYFGNHGPQRPPGNFPGMSPVSRGQVPPDYGWPGMQHPGEPPPEWRGPAMRPAYGAPGQGDRADMWAQRPPQSSPFAPPGFPSAPQHGQVRDADPKARDTRGPGIEQSSVPVSVVPSDLSLVTNASQADDDKPPPPRTVADRFNNVRIVRSALGEKLITYLKTSGVRVDNEVVPAIAGEELGPAGEAAMVRECARLGLDGGAQRARLPMPGPLKLPACTAELSHVGLWDKFKRRCGTPLPAEPQPIPFEIRKSQGGGQVVVPLIAATNVASTPAVATC